MLNKIGTPFTRNDLQLLTRLTHQATIALEHASLIEQVSNLAITDELTGLFNARYLDQTLDWEIRRCSRYRSTVAVIFLDLDHFNAINALYGHPIGSLCLTELAQIMRKSVRDVDIAARYGGDEFVVILPETTVATARMVAERLRKAIQMHAFGAGASLSRQLTASIGDRRLSRPCQIKTRVDVKSRRGNVSIQGGGRRPGDDRKESLISRFAAGKTVLCPGIIDRDRE